MSFLRYNERQVIWKGITFPYAISDLGQVRSLKTEHIRVLTPDDGGYLQVCLKHEGVRHHVKIHVLVALTYIGPRPAGKDLHHKDGDKRNNCVSNLEYTSRGLNNLHACRTGLRKRTQPLGNLVLNEDKVREIKKLIQSGVRNKDIAQKFGLNKNTVANVKSGQSWGYVTI